MKSGSPAKSVRKPGPPSFQDLVSRIDHALRYMGDRIELNRNPLTRLAAVEKRSQVHAGRIHPRAIALRELVEQAVSDVIAELDADRALGQVREFLVLYHSGAKVADAAKALGISREHCCRAVKRRAVELVAEKFSQLIAPPGQARDLDLPTPLPVHAPADLANPSTTRANSAIIPIAEEETPRGSSSRLGKSPGRRSWRRS